MVSIIHKDELKDWLGGKARAVETIIAARAALRTLPLIQQAYDRRYDSVDQLTLVAFRAGAVSWGSIAGNNWDYPRHFTLDALSAAENAYHHANAAGVDAAAYAVRALGAVCGIFASATYGADVAADAVRAARAVYGVNANASDAMAGNMWFMVQEDANYIERTGAAEGLVEAPINSLFADLDSPSHKMTKESAQLSAFWSKLSLTLRKLNQDWDVWIDWYEDRCAGRKQNATFEKALLTLTEEEWKDNPADVNILIKDRMKIGQRAAVSIFEFRSGRIEGGAYALDPESAPSLAQGLYEELKEDLCKLKKRLEGFEGIPTVDDIVDDIDRTLRRLGERLEDADLGGLIALCDKFKNASWRIRILNEEAQYNVPRDYEINLSSLHDQLKKYLGLYGRDLKLIEDRAAALDVKPDDFEANEAILKDVIEIAKRSTVVAESAVTALQVGFEEKDKLSERITDLADRYEELRNELKSDRAQEQAREIRNHENFLEEIAAAAKDGVKESVKQGVKEAAKDATTSALKALTKKLLGPAGRLATRYSGQVINWCVDQFRISSEEDGDADMDE